MRTNVCSAFHTMSKPGILSATNSAANSAPLAPITHQSPSISRPPGSTAQCNRASTPSVKTVAYTLRPAAKLAAITSAAIVLGEKCMADLRWPTSYALRFTHVPHPAYKGGAPTRHQMFPEVPMPTDSTSLLERIASGRTDLVFEYLTAGNPATAGDTNGVSLLQ